MEAPFSVVEAAFAARDWHGGQGSALYALSCGVWGALSADDYRRAAAEFLAVPGDVAGVHWPELYEHAQELLFWAGQLDHAGQAHFSR